MKNFRFKLDFVPEVLRHQRQNEQSGKIFLLIDNAPSHSSLQELNSFNENFEVVYLPPNTTAIMQPLDQGVIALVKKIYRKSILEEFYFQNESKRLHISELVKGIDVLNCMGKMKDAWDYVNDTTIRKMWKQLLGDLVVFEPKQEIVVHDSICNDVVNLFEYTEKEREKVRAEIIEWLNRDDADPGWEPLSDDQIIASVTYNFNQKDCTTNVTLTPLCFTAKHIESLNEMEYLLKNDISCPQSCIESFQRFKSYIAEKVQPKDISVDVYNSRSGDLVYLDL